MTYILFSKYLISIIREVFKKIVKGYPPPPLFAANNQFPPHIFHVAMGKERGMGGLFYVFTLLHGSEHSEHFCFCFVFGLIPKHLFFSGQINVQFVKSKELNSLEQSQN